LKLFFVNLKISPTFESTLLSSGVSFQTKAADSEAVIYGIQSLHELKQFSKQYHNTSSLYRVAVIPRTLLLEVSFQKELLKSSAQDAVWTLEDWETLFFVHTQQYERWKQYQKDKHSLHQLTTKTNLLIQQFEKDLGLAETIQKSLLPKVEPGIPGISLAVKYLPASGLGGDYYDIFELEDKRRFGLLVADSQTHGMAAALLTVLLKLQLEELKNDFPDSKSLVTHLNNQITTGESSASSLNLVYGILDRTNLSFEYCAAGPLRPLLWRNSKLITLSQESNPPVGQLKNHSYHQSVFQLLPGDLLLFNTNGLEAPFKARGLSLLEGISDAFASVQGNDPVLFQNELLAQINRYKEAEEELPDDITLIQVAVDNKAIYLAQSK